MLRTAELLGLEAMAVSEKCSHYSAEYVLQILGKGMDRQKLIDHARKNFTQDELLYLALNWLSEKTEMSFKEILEERKAKNDAKQYENPGTKE